LNCSLAISIEQIPNLRISTATIFMDFGIMFFSASTRSVIEDKYALLREAACFADCSGFVCIWIPERHFHEFGGLFPNPSVLAASVAVLTSRVQIRAGSVVSPIHDAIRIAEEWSVVDNLSHGRAAVSFGSGWNISDFVFFPERYVARQAVMYQQIEFIRKFWAGELVEFPTALNNKVKITLSPKPVQSQLPIWITSSGSAKTFETAGTIGANILTHLIGQDIASLAEKILIYRQARRRAGFTASRGIVSLMLHTFVGPDPERVKEEVSAPFREYLTSALSLELRAAGAGGSVSGGRTVSSVEMSGEGIEELVEIALARYLKDSSLIGTEEMCAERIWRFKEIGVDEVACLIDFGVPERAVLDSLRHLNSLRASFTEPQARAEEVAKATFMDKL
jgi:natural product biosynthesis luciferase-like monooxygenase protein